MQRTAILLALSTLLSATSCTSVDQVRLSGGAELSRLDGRANVPGGAAVRESADGNGTVGRVEVNRVSELGPTVGLFVEVGSAEYDTGDEVDQYNVGGGILVRQFLTEGRIRPFVEGRLGYRHTWLDVGAESANAGGILTGAALGVELSHSDGIASFLQVGYSFSSTTMDDFHGDFHGPAIMFGGAFSF